MFEKIIILLKKDLEIEAKVIEEIKKASKSKDVSIIAFEEIKKEILSDSDLVITLGGDGTFIKAANLIENSFILGINANPTKSEGALTSLDIIDLDKLKSIFDGQFKITKRTMANIKLNGKKLQEHALNEVYIGTASQFHTSRYKIKFNGNEEEHRSSGIIVSTGTGSPAWFYSAGGKVFGCDEEKLGFVVREPYFGKRVFTPKILNGYIKKGEKIIIESKRDSGGIIAINDVIYDFNQGDVVEVELSDKHLNVINLK